MAIAIGFAFLIWVVLLLVVTTAFVNAVQEALSPPHPKPDAAEPPSADPATAASLRESVAS